MRFEHGSTRWVLLVDNKAIKIGRIGIFRLVARIMLFPFMGQRWKVPMKDALKSYLLYGILANRREYQYYRETQDVRVVPTTHMLLFGLITLQDRGVAISLKELMSECLLYDEAHRDLDDVSDACHRVRELDMSSLLQYVRLPDGSIRLADYASEPAVSWLRSSVRPLRERASS